MSPLPRPELGTLGPGPGTPQAATLVAASGKDGKPLCWLRSLDSLGGRSVLRGEPIGAREALVGVLRSAVREEMWIEVVSPSDADNRVQPSNGRVQGWVGCRVLDGVTGQTRWERRFSIRQGDRPDLQRAADQYAVGPDLNGDGRPELLHALPMIGYRRPEQVGGPFTEHQQPFVVLIFRHLETLSHEEIAARMNRSPGAVRMLWVRALAALREACGQELVDPHSGSR